jgi:hypothetical protein
MSRDEVLPLYVLPHYSGSPFSGFILFKSGSVAVTKGAELLGHFNKTGMSDRQCCRTCGGHRMTHHPGLGLTDIRTGILASITFKPVVHLNYSEAVLPVKDGLPKLKDFPTAVGGSGELLLE